MLQTDCREELSNAVFMMSVCLWSCYGGLMVLIIYQQIFGLLLQTQCIHVIWLKTCVLRKFFLCWNLALHELSGVKGTRVLNIPWKGNGIFVGPLLKESLGNVTCWTYSNKSLISFGTALLFWLIQQPCNMLRRCLRRTRTMGRVKWVLGPALLMSRAFWFLFHKYSVAYTEIYSPFIINPQNKY